MKKIIPLAALAMLALVGAGCNSYNAAPNNASNTAVNPQPAETTAVESSNTVNTPDATSSNPPVTVVKPEPVKEPVVESASVSIQNFSFTPATLTVKKGATVAWTNNDSAPHTIQTAIFTSDTLNRGQSFSFTFNDAGTFDYICSIHPSMQGKIIVE